MRSTLMALAALGNIVGINGGMAGMAFNTGNFGLVGCSVAGDIQRGFFVTFQAVVRGEAGSPGPSRSGQKCQKKGACQQQAG